MNSPPPHHSNQQGLIVFDIDGEQWTLDAREGSGQLYQGRPKGGDKPDLTLTLSDENFAKLVAGKLNPQQVCQCAGFDRQRH